MTPLCSPVLAHNVMGTFSAILHRSVLTVSDILPPSGRSSERRAAFVEAVDNWPNTVNVIPLTLKGT